MRVLTKDQARCRLLNGILGTMALFLAIMVGCLVFAFQRFVNEARVNDQVSTDKIVALTKQKMALEERVNILETEKIYLKAMVGGYDDYVVRLLKHRTHENRR